MEKDLHIHEIMRQYEDKIILTHLEFIEKLVCKRWQFNFVFKFPFDFILVKFLSNLHFLP